MKVLQVHNSYRHFGGEDVVANLEYELLKRNDICAEQLLFNNETLSLTDLFYSKASYKKLESVIKKRKPDVIHVHNLFYKASPSILQCAKDHNIPVVLTLHNYRLICPNGLLLRDGKPCVKCVNKTFPISAIKYSCFQESKSKTLALSLSLTYHNKMQTWNKLVDKFIVLTPFAKKTFMDSALNIDEGKIIVKPNSIDDFNNEINDKRKDYVFIGRLSSEKGIQIAVEAFNQLSHINLHVIGSGPLEESLKAQGNKNIIFHGIKDRAFIKNILPQSKALIFPSLCYEGLPNTIIEAFSSGTPVIYSNNDNVNTIVENNKTGLSFKTGNINSLKETILNFENIKDSKLNTNAREKYLTNYTHKKNILSLLKIYEEAIGANEENRYIKPANK